MQKIIGVLLVLLSTLVFTVGQVFVKITATDLHIVHLLFWRSFIGLIIIVCIALAKKKIPSAWIDLEPEARKWLLIRGGVGLVALSLFFLSLSMAELGTVGAIINLNPVFAVFFAWLFLKEKLNPVVWLSLGLGISGVLFVSNPFTASLSFSHLFLFGGAIALGFILTAIKKLTTLGVETWVIVSALMITGVIAFSPGFFIIHQVYTFKILAFVLVVGVCTTCGQFLVTISARYIKAQTISILNLVSIFELMIMGFLFFNEIITAGKIVGGSLIMMSSAIVMYSSIHKVNSLKGKKKNLKIADTN